MGLPHGCPSLLLVQYWVRLGGEPSHCERPKSHAEPAGTMELLLGTEPRREVLGLAAPRRARLQEASSSEIAEEVGSSGDGCYTPKPPCSHIRSIGREVQRLGIMGSRSIGVIR